MSLITEGQETPSSQLDKEKQRAFWFKNLQGDEIELKAKLSDKVSVFDEQYAELTGIKLKLFYLFYSIQGKTISSKGILLNELTNVLGENMNEENLSNIVFNVLVRTKGGIN